MRLGLAVWGVVSLGCQAAPPVPPAVQGSALVLDIRPANQPAMVGAFDFELLGQGTGKACVTRGGNTVYWVGMNDLARLAPDPLTQKAIAAAAHDAIGRIEDNVDTIIVTSVVVTSEDHRSACATVQGRGVRLIKASTVARTTDQAAKETDAN